MIHSLFGRAANRRYTGASTRAVACVLQIVSAAALVAEGAWDVRQGMCEHSEWNPTPRGGSNPPTASSRGKRALCHPSRLRPVRSISAWWWQGGWRTNPAGVVGGRRWNAPSSARLTLERKAPCPGTDSRSRGASWAIEPVRWPRCGDRWPSTRINRRSLQRSRRCSNGD